MEDDKELESIANKYSSGEMLTGEMDDELHFKFTDMAAYTKDVGAVSKNIIPFFRHLNISIHDSHNTNVIIRFAMINVPVSIPVMIWKIPH